jgi:hypothetical protein
MLLGGVYCAGKNNLIVRGQTLNVQRYCDDILRTVVVPFMRRNNRFDFQQDNARPDLRKVFTRPSPDTNAINCELKRNRVSFEKILSCIFDAWAGLIMLKTMLGQTLLVSP